MDANNTDTRTAAIWIRRSTLALKRRPLLRDVTTYSISLVLLVIFIDVHTPGCVGTGEAGFLFL